MAINYFGKEVSSNAGCNITSSRSMDGDSKPYFRHYRHDFPQDTQLFNWYLSHHHWDTGYYRLLKQVKMTSRVKAVL
jgi:hypothetical protein